MLDSGMQFTISTVRTPAAPMEPMKDVRLSFYKNIRDEKIVLWYTATVVL